MTRTSQTLNFLDHSDTQHCAALLCLFAAFPRFVLASIMVLMLIRPLARATAHVQLWLRSLKSFND